MNPDELNNGVVSNDGASDVPSTDDAMAPQAPAEEMPGAPETDAPAA